MNRNAVDTQKHYNLDYLNGFANGNINFVREMIGIFVNEVPDKLLSFENAIHEEDFAAIKQAAHNMKSTIPFFGLERFIENEINEIEQLATDELNIIRIKLLFQKVKSVCVKVVGELREK